VTWSISSSTLPARGETSNGDATLVRQEDGITLIAVIDVLGHGVEAAKVAELATSYLRGIPLARARDAMIGLHEHLRGTRGAAATICILTGRHLDGCGVGNVELRVLGTQVATLLTPGILGHRLHRLREFASTLAFDDRLIFFSDGISSRVPFGEMRKLAPRDACHTIMQQHRRPHDDATILIADLKETS
jgi:negative regulator of sigma-B (phosphoserine phosphatase)